MKNLLLIISYVFISLTAVSQVKMDVWNKSSKTGQTVTNSQLSQMPISFESSLPDGNTEIYDKWDVPTIEIESSSKKKYTFKPNAYKGRRNMSILTYTNLGWEGMYQSSTGEFYSMTPTSITKDTTKPKGGLDGCSPMVPPSTFLDKTPQKTVPQMSNLTNADYYNPAVPINKNLTVYAEVTNDLHVSLGNNLTTTQNWVTNLFLAVSTIFASEGLTVSLNKIYVWESVDPYGYQTTSSSGCILGGGSFYSTFCIGFTDNIKNNLPVNPNNTTTGVTSHFKHLLHGRQSLGGIAWMGGNSNGYDINTWAPNVGTFWSTAVSGFNVTSESSLTTTGYNWPVFVASHEMGHNLGSPHTHWCKWKNDVGTVIGRLDSCYVGEYTSPNTYCTVEPCPSNCTQSTYISTKPNNNGTIMSYCHLNGSVNLSSRFGKYPRFAMRSTVDQSPYIINPSSTIPTVATNSLVTNITGTTATSGGDVTNGGGGSLLSKGVCWSISPTIPTVSLSTKTNDGIAIGPYTSNITGLRAITTYNVRAYATNSAGTSYGIVRTFTTGPPSKPTLTTVLPNTIGQTSGKSGGTIISDGGGDITEKGVIYSTGPLFEGEVVQYPNVPRTNDGTGSANFISSITNLTLGVTYNVKAYATNWSGIGWGQTVTFTTNTAVTPTLTTSSVTTFTNTTATLGGNVSASGGATVSRRGVCYATTQNPTIANTVVNIGSGTGSFSQNVTGLSQGVTYYVRAFAENSAGINYGTQVSFKTLTIPSVSTTSASNLTTTSFTTGGNVTSAGGGSLTVTARGVCYSTSTNPSLTNGTVLPSGTGTGTFTTNITGLTQGLTYYVRAYATNTYGTAYGSQITVKTLTVPTVTTRSSTALSKTGFTTGGNVTSAGGGTLTVTERGIVYSTTVQDPTTSNTKVLAATPTGTGSYTISLTGLTPGTIYYVRAYAINSVGTGYGSRITVTTPREPVLTTTAITSVSTTSASSGGTISSSTGSSVTARGVCYSTTPNPTTSNTKTSNGTGTGTFTSSITGLSPSTTYYVRAYATNTTGTGYGNELSFTTTSTGSQPSLTTTAASGITQTTASSGGNVTADGGSTVTARGICYATTQNPTTSNTVVNSGTGIGVFTSSLSGLTPSTTYYIRAFATNANGTNYGTQVSFTTLSSITTPTLTTNTVTSITTTSALSGGNISSDGGATVTARGICYATTQNPTTSNTTISSGTGTGSFSVSITGLTSGVTYYVRAYATNSSGTNYGTQQSFTTLSVPTLSTTSASGVTATTATTGGNITSDGGATVTGRGVCYATTQNPTTSNTTVSGGTGVGAFTSNLTGLTSNTTYYVRAYATNSAGTNYGSQISFTTTSAQVPSLTTDQVINITTNSAQVRYTLVSLGSGTLTEKGFVYSTSPNPTTSNFKQGELCEVTNPCDVGQYTSPSLTSLTSNTTYYVRAYAISSAGTAYGNQIQFTTLPSAILSCTVTNMSMFIGSGYWRFKWNLNTNCNSYTVNLQRYNYTNSSIEPPVGATPAAVGNRLTNYVPTAADISQGFIDQQMSPQPSQGGYWYSFEVKCNAQTCSGTNTTRSGYFYVGSTPASTIGR